MHRSSCSYNTGFTLIEMIVSLAVFSIVMTTTVGALLVLISGNTRLQSEQSVMTNLAFALDSMTREIRTGYNLYCDSFADYGGATNFMSDSVDHEAELADRVRDCASGRTGGNDLQGVSFYEGGKSIIGSAAANRIAYFYDADAATIKRRVGNAAAQSIISSGLRILNAEFHVTGAADLRNDGDFEQPTVTIYIRAEDVNGGKTYDVQTTVVQRIFDL